MATASPALAQGVFTTTTSLTESLLFNPASLTTSQVDLFSTQVLGRLNGGTVFDQTFAVASSDAAVQTGLNSARLAITASGGPGVIIGAPHLLSSTTTMTSASVSIYSLAGQTSLIEPGVITFGPATVPTGALSTCSVSGLPSATRPTCISGGTPLVIGGFDTNVNVNTSTTYTIDTATTTTNTTTVAEVWAVDGTVKPVGLVHAAVQSAGFDAADGFLDRLSHRAGGIPRPASVNLPVLTQLDLAPTDYWLDFYGSFGITPADGATPGDTRKAGGFDAGLSAQIASGLSLAIALNHGVTSIAVVDTGEDGTLRLTQAGLALARDNGDWLVRGAAAAGLGEATGTTTSTGTSTANYGVGTAGVMAEIGRNFEVEAVKLTPLLGADLTLMHSDAFTGAGGMALAAPAHDATQLRVWLGLESTMSWLLEDGTLSLTGHGRLVGTPFGSERTLPVTFASMPGTPLTITGAQASPLAVELGGTARLDLGSFELQASYDAHIQPDAISHAGHVGVHGRF